MAATKYDIPISGSAVSIINEVESALNAKALITSTLYKNSGYLIFSTPLTSKVIKIYINGSKEHIALYYGDQLISGSTISNQVQFGLQNSEYASGYPSAMEVIADANYFALLWHTSQESKQALGYVGALSNGDAFVFGVTNRNDASSSGVCIGKNITANKSLFPIAFSGSGFKDASGNLLTMPLMWADSSNVLEMDGAGPAGTLGVKVSSVRNINSASWGGGVGYMLTPSVMFYGTGASISSSLVLEYTP